MSKVTEFLNVVEAGNPHAARNLMPLVDDDLCRLASGKLEPGGGYSWPNY